MKTVDAKGLECPKPVIEAKKAAESMEDGGTLVVLVDNEVAVENLTKFAKSKNFSVSSKALGEKEFEVTMEVRTGFAAESDPNEEIVCQVPGNKGYCAVISSDTMGSGDDKLGKNLIKAFIFALTQQDELPKAVLCYNGGVKLTCEGSESLDDLKTLVENGVRVLSCGTCLDFYSLKDKLAVGEVTNMYEIVEVQSKSGAVIRP